MSALSVVIKTCEEFQQRDFSFDGYMLEIRGKNQGLLHTVALIRCGAKIFKNGVDYLTLCDMFKRLPHSYAQDVMNKESSKELLQAMRAQSQYYS